MKDNYYFQRNSCMEEASLTPLIKLQTLQKGEQEKGTAEFHMIIFLLQGDCWLTSDFYSPQVVEEGYAVFIPLQGCYDFTARKCSRLLIMQGDLFQKQMGGFSLETLYRFYPESKEEQSLLPIKPLLMMYLKQIELYLDHCFDNIEFFDIKIQELQILLSHFYSPGELASFFRSVLNSDPTFASFVLNNWHGVKSVQELAGLSHYCETGFRKKFRQVFGISPYKWIQQKRSARLYYEIVNNKKPFKLIAEEYGFKSIQHFNEYCNRYFKCTPGALRKNTV